MSNDDLGGNIEAAAPAVSNDTGNQPDSDPVNHEESGTSQPMSQAALRDSIVQKLEAGKQNEETDSEAAEDNLATSEEDANKSEKEEPQTVPLPELIKTRKRAQAAEASLSTLEAKFESEKIKSQKIIQALTSMVKQSKEELNKYRELSPIEAENEQYKMRDELAKLSAQIKQDMEAQTQKVKQQHAQKVQQMQREMAATQLSQEIDSALSKYPGVSRHSLFAEIAQADDSVPVLELAKKIDEANLQAYRDRALANVPHQAPKPIRSQGSASNHRYSNMDDLKQSIVRNMQLKNGVR